MLHVQSIFWKKKYRWFWELFGSALSVIFTQEFIFVMLGDLHVALSVIALIFKRDLTIANLHAPLFV